MRISDWSSDVCSSDLIGVDGSTMEANAALRTIVRRDNGETYREMLVRMAQESGIDTPTIDDLVRLDRNRKGKKLSNADWASKTDPDAKDRKSVVWGKSVSGRIDIGGGRNIEKKKES